MLFSKILLEKYVFTSLKYYICLYSNAKSFRQFYVVLNHIILSKSAHLMSTDVKCANLFYIKRLFNVSKSLYFRHIQNSANKPTKKHTLF